MKSLQTKRVYDPTSKDDGQRVLVDRLWPRGLSKQAAAIDVWLREIAPSDALRQWYRHDPALWDEFRRRYFAELDANAEAVHKIRHLVAAGPVTLLFASKAQQHNNADALRDYLIGTR